MADELVQQMEQMDINQMTLLGLPTEIIQNIFNYLRIAQKELAESTVKASPEYDRFMRTPVPLPPNRMITSGERLDIINEAEREFLAQAYIPYMVALRHFRDLARKREHEIN